MRAPTLVTKKPSSTSAKTFSAPTLLILPYGRSGSRVSPIFASKLTPKPTTQATKSEEANFLVRGLVSAATETLRLLGVGATSAPPATIPAGSSERPEPGNILAVLATIAADYSERSYFITGVISDGIYDEECFFADPTVSFKGRELWKRNLQLLVPFLESPSIELLDLIKLTDPIDPQDVTTAANASSNSSTSSTISSSGDKIPRGAVLRADWILRTGLKLPWRPYIDVRGSTEYELAWPENNRIVRHIESWNISGWEAVLLVFTPGQSKAN